MSATATNAATPVATATRAATRLGRFAVAAMTMIAAGPARAQAGAAGAEPAASRAGDTTLRTKTLQMDFRSTGDMTSERLQVLVLPLVAEGVDAALARIAGDLVARELAKRSDLKVITFDDLNALLAKEKLSDAVGCEEVSCSTEIAGAVGADRILAGRLALLDGDYVLTLRWLDAEYSESLGTAVEVVPSGQVGFAAGVQHALATLFNETVTASDQQHRRTKGKPTYWTAELAAGGSKLQMPEDYEGVSALLRVAWGGRPTGGRLFFYLGGGVEAARFSGRSSGAIGYVDYSRTQIIPFLELRAALPVANRERTRIFAYAGAGLDIETFVLEQSGGITEDGTLFFPELRFGAGLWHRWNNRFSIWAGYGGRLIRRGDGADAVSEQVKPGSTKDLVPVHSGVGGLAIHF